MGKVLQLDVDRRAKLLRRGDLPAETLVLAPFLVGKLLFHSAPDGMAGGRIVETEAYPPGDAAGHAFTGPSQRNGSLFRAHGHVYIYRAYGTSWMLNISSEGHGVGAGVLIRAIEPLFGLALMQQRRPLARPRDLARGPGRLTAALGINASINGTVVGPSGPVMLADDGFVADVGRSVRIGISKNAGRTWRFFQRGSPYVSGSKLLNAGA